MNSQQYKYPGETPRY